MNKVSFIGDRDDLPGGREQTDDDTTTAEENDDRAASLWQPDSNFFQKSNHLRILSSLFLRVLLRSGNLY